MTDFIYISPFMCPFLDKEIWRALNYTSSFMCLFLDLNDIISLGLYEVIYVFNSWLRWILIFVIKVMAGGAKRAWCSSTQYKHTHHSWN